MAQVFDTPEQIGIVQMRVLRSVLRLEMKGIKVWRGRTAYSSIKKEYNVKGSRQKVLDFISEMIDATEQQKGEA